MAKTNLTKQQKEYIAVILLVVVSLFIGMQKFKKKGGDDEVFSRSEFNEKWKEVEILEKMTPKGIEAISYIDSERIPFEGPFDKEKEEPEADENITLPALTFQGMVWSSQRPQAIIDNKVYDIGDSIVLGQDQDEIKVKDISKNGMILEYKSKEFIVRPK